MNCAVLSTIYLRANGEIPCYDDAGGNLTLASLTSEKSVSITALLSTPFYTHLREALSNGKAPWINVCDKCAMLRESEEFIDGLSQKKITTLQVEPTLACALSCPGCTQKADLRNRRRPAKLTPTMFDAFLTSLMEESYSIDLIEYCGNGEPLNHPEFADFALAARKRFPKTPQRLVTNGNFDFTALRLAEIHINQYMISCDGATQASYERYRVGGTIDKVFRFMKAIPSYVAGYKQLKIWKYILFEHNDSDEELRTAQLLAEDLELDQIVFVTTHSELRSSRFAGNDVHDIPLVSSRASIDLTPMHGISRKMLRPLEAITPVYSHPADSFLMLDSVEMTRTGVILIRGWALSRKPCQLRLTINDVFIGETQPGLLRLDVSEAFPHYNNSFSGFQYIWRTKDFTESFASLSVLMFCGEVKACEQRATFVFRELKVQAEGLLRL